MSLSQMNRVLLAATVSCPKVAICVCILGDMTVDDGSGPNNGKPACLES